MMVNMMKVKSWMLSSQSTSRPAATNNEILKNNPLSTKTWETLIRLSRNLIEREECLSSMKTTMMMVARKALRHKTSGALENLPMTTVQRRIREDLTILISPITSSWIQEREAEVQIMTDMANL